MPDGRFRPRLPGKRDRLPPCATREEATSLLDAALVELASGGVTAPGGQTLRAWGEDYLDLRELNGIRSIVTDRSRWKVHVLAAPFIDWPLGAVTRAEVRQWLDKLLAKPASSGRGYRRPLKKRKISRSTVQSTLNLLRCAFDAAVEREMLTTNPVDGVRLPRSSGVTHEPWTYLLPEEQQALLTCEAIPVADRLLIAFALGTGMRQGELWNLHLVDLGALRVTVRYGSRGKATKGGRIRRVPLFGLAADALEQWLPMLAAQKNPQGLVWPLPGGERRQKGKRPRRWLEYLEAAGLIAEGRHDGQPVRFHDLRHSCASSLVAGWWGRRWSLEEVKGLLGHRSITTTERYAHLADSALDTAARETVASSMLSSTRPLLCLPEHTPSAAASRVA